MGRLWLALVLLVGFGTTAWADSGAEPSNLTVPERSANDSERPAAESKPYVIGDPQRPHGEADLMLPERRCGTGATGMLIFGVTVIGGFIIGICAIVILRRTRRLAQDPATPVSLLVAEYAARSTRTRSGIFGLLGLGGLLTLLSIGIPVFPVIFAIWTIPALRGFWIASAALRIIESTGASAEATISTITVRAGDRYARLNLTPSELAAARERGVPKASASE